MSDFMIQFFICNLFISGMIGILVAAKRIFKKSLSCQMQYHLWFLLLGLLAVPFIPFTPPGFPQLFAWLEKTASPSVSPNGTILTTPPDMNSAQTADWTNDFAISVKGSSLSSMGYLLFCIWIAGIFVMLLFMLKAHLHLRILKKSTLPLQNQNIRQLYDCCLKECGITRAIPIRSTAFLKSPVIAGFLNPCIYLPLHLISDYKESDMRYMLLHELCHYKHKDALVGYLMNFAGVFYWFNPFVWYAFREMHSDREIACDSSVLNMLEEDSYEDYGNTLLQFAEKISLTPFRFFTGLSGNVKQITRRIINIASYEKPSLRKQLKGFTAFLLTAALLLGISPVLSTYAANVNRYTWKTESKTITHVNLSSYFGDYEGSFVLYDQKNNTWNIYNMDRALLRVSPDSTYKIYDALFGLEEGIITPKESFLPWNGDFYSIEAWNKDQTLQSAMQASVNWYFQEIDRQLGASLISEYVQKIGYGNERIRGDISSYWSESSLKISPIEQVELLTNLYNNRFGFASQNIEAVKDALRLSSSETETFYGKTGTGRIENQDISGWFTGFVETADNTWFFATNIRADKDAAGSNAAEITMSILTDLNLLSR